MEKLTIRPILRNRLIRFRSSLLNSLFPKGTRRGEFVSIINASLQVISNEGLESYIKQALEKLKYRNFTVYLQKFNNYDTWLNCSQLTKETLTEMRDKSSSFEYRPKISIIMPVHNTDEKWLTAAIDSVSDQVYSNWELCIVNTANRSTVTDALKPYTSRESRIKVKRLENEASISVASNEALRMSTGDFVGILDCDAELTPDALYEVVRALNENPGLDLIYSDEDEKTFDGRRVEPFFKPDWSPDLLMSLNYISHFSAVRRSLIEKVEGFREQFEGNHDYDLFLRVTEITNKIWHIPKILYSQRQLPPTGLITEHSKRIAAVKALRESLVRRKLKGDVSEGFGSSYRVRYCIEKNPLVSIIIPARTSRHISNCVRSILEKTSYSNYEILVIDRTGEDLAKILPTSSRLKISRDNSEFNFSRINNQAIKFVRGEFFVFLNDDTEVICQEWLSAMLEHSQRPEVGVVGTLLLYPANKPEDARIQHAGVLIGVGGVACHAFIHLRASYPHYFDLHRVIRNCSAVTGACAMVKRKVFDEVGGFEEKLRVAYGDIDLCLRVLEKGYRNIYTPYSAMYHKEGGSRRSGHPDEDEVYMINRWGNFIIKGDPYYNANLTLLETDYSIASNAHTIRPLSVLMDYYNVRRDLRKKYPEAAEGDYKRLAEWAATRGITDPRSQPPLRPYAAYYSTYLSQQRSCP